MLNNENSKWHFSKTQFQAKRILVSIEIENILRKKNQPT